MECLESIECIRVLRPAVCCVGFQLEESETLGRVMLYCQATAGLVMTELHKLSNENLLIKAGECFTFPYAHIKAVLSFNFVTVLLTVIAVSNLACGLFNRRLYDQAFSLVEILCKDLCRNCPMSLSVERVSFFLFLNPYEYLRALH